MAISKKERSLSIWIGIAIGVALSSMLVRYALQKKSEQTNERPGNYKSLSCAADGSPFLKIPEPIRKKIPHGIVVYFESNQTDFDSNITLPIKSWIIESAGSFRSERLFVLAQEFNPNPSYKFYRASELYLRPVVGTTMNKLENILNENKFKIIGNNSKTGEWILQIKDFSPTGYRHAIKKFTGMKNHISSVRAIPWSPIR